MIGSAKSFFWNISLILVVFFLTHNNWAYLRGLIHVHVVCDDDEIKQTGISITPLLCDEKSSSISIQGPDLRRNTELSCGKEKDYLGSLWDQNYWPDQNLIAPDSINCLLLSHPFFFLFKHIQQLIIVTKKPDRSNLEQRVCFGSQFARTQSRLVGKLMMMEK